MSKQYTETDFQHIVNNLIDYLLECEDGTDITTSQLLRAVSQHWAYLPAQQLSPIRFRLLLTPVIIS